MWTYFLRQQKHVLDVICLDAVEIEETFLVAVGLGVPDLEDGGRHSGESGGRHGLYVVPRLLVWLPVLGLGVDNALFTGS